MYGIHYTISRGNLGSVEIWLGNTALVFSPVYLLHFQKPDAFGGRGSHGCGNEYFGFIGVTSCIRVDRYRRCEGFCCLSSFHHEDGSICLFRTLTTLRIC
jgi:hypothetical protein